MQSRDCAEGAESSAILQSERTTAKRPETGAASRENGSGSTGSSFETLDSEGGATGGSSGQHGHTETASLQQHDAGACSHIVWQRESAAAGCSRTARARMNRIRSAMCRQEQDSRTAMGLKDECSRGAYRPAE